MVKKTAEKRVPIAQAGTLLFHELEAPGAKESTYDPLPSVWYGDDAGLLEEMLCFYPRKPPQDILDEIAALDAESAEVLATIRGLV